MSHPSGRHFLQIPGPTNVPDRVLRAIAAPTIDHRGRSFQALALEVFDLFEPGVRHPGPSRALSGFGDRGLGGGVGQHAQPR
jgi:alanine-glyoxylate transaminase/serine-glyoxylate transaminase/serine-pyruvate transaminase